MILFAIAFLVRDVRLGSFAWPDEVTWTARSVAFYASLAEGDLRGTHQADHPGVVPMWGYGGLLSLRAPDKRRPAQPVHHDHRARHSRTSPLCWRRKPCGPS